MKVLPQARLSPIQRLRYSAALHNEPYCRSTTCWTWTVVTRQRCSQTEASPTAVTLGRRAAAWFTRSTTDCSAFPTSSDIATFHIPSNGYDTKRKETSSRWRNSAFKIKVLLRRKRVSQMAPSVDQASAFESYYREDVTPVCSSSAPLIIG